MKKKSLVAAISAMLVIGTAITSFADTYDPQYPLKGYMEPWLINSPVTGETAWKSDPHNFINEPVGPMQYALDLAIANKDPLSLSYFRARELAAIAKLTNYRITGLEGVDQEKLEQLTTELRDFLNSFDWRTASDYEKAVHIAKRITKADYLDQEGTQYPYSCLVEGKANCNGYAWTARLLGASVGLPVEELGTVSHTYPVFLVDGVWLSYEPTSKDDYFNIAEVYTPAFLLAGEPHLTPLGEYCEATGYQVPITIEGKFPNITYGYIYGVRAPFINFK